MVHSSPILLVPVKKYPNVSVIIMLFLGENKQKQINTKKNPPKKNPNNKKEAMTSFYKQRIYLRIILVRGCLTLT